MFSTAAVAEAILRYCRTTDASVTSGYRTELHNGALKGSVPDSPHTRGLAADVVYDHPGVATTRETFASDLGLEIVHESDHDHLQPKGWKDGAR
jgi:hypothetical protein